MLETKPFDNWEDGNNCLGNYSDFRLVGIGNLEYFMWKKAIIKNIKRKNLIRMSTMFKGC